MIQITSVRHDWPNPPGYRLKRQNGHPDYTFVHFTTSVKLYLNGEEITVPEHACIIYLPGTPQHFYCPKGMIHDWFHFTNAPMELLKSLDMPTDVLIYPKQWSIITNLVEEIENEFYAQKEHNEYLIDLKVNELLIKLSRSVKNKYPEIKDNKLTSDLRRVRSKIMQHLSDDWTVAKMATELPLSPSRFAHIYKAFYGTSPMDDLIRARIEAAKNALSSTELTVCEISNSLGYGNVTHFNRQFHKIIGVSPSQYRKNSR